MRILQLCNKVPYPPKDGGSVAIFNMARGLAIIGHAVDILAMETSKHPRAENEAPLPDKITLESFFVDTVIKPFDLIKNLILSKEPYNAVRFVNEEFARRIAEKLKEQNYDVVQLEGLYLAPYIKTIRENSSAKISLRSHNIENEIWKRLYSNEKYSLKKFYFGVLARRVERMEKEVLNTYDFLIPITYRDAVEYQKYGNKKPVKVIQTGIPAVEIDEKPTTRNIRQLYFIGSLDWLPNQEGVLWFKNKVWPMLLNSHPDLEFHVAGRNAPEWFKKEIQGTNIVFHGEVTNAREFTNHYDIMIVPLLSGGGMRVKIVEAMSLGKVVVTTSIGAEGLDVIPNYHAIITDTPEEFATGVEILLHNTDFFTKLSENSVRFIKNNYTNRVLAGELANFYESNS